MKYYDNLYKEGRIDNYIEFVITVNKNNYKNILVGAGSEYATIHVWKENDILKMDFSGYVYGKGIYTIKNEKEKINLYN